MTTSFHRAGVENINTTQRDSFGLLNQHVVGWSCQGDFNAIYH